MNCVRCATPIPDAARFCFACGADVAVSGDALAAKLQEELGVEFTVEHLLGRGGMGLVYLASEPRLGRKVAIKVLPPELTFGRGMVERFLREARTAATLDHPHIVPIYRVSGEGELFWYMMKFLDRESLADILERDRVLPTDRTANLVSQVAEALEFAHERGVIHRDIKPDNVMVGSRDWVTVTDFGIAKALDGSSFTSSGATLGTPYYMSPEQCVGSKTLTGASDQYSLAVMAYQMVSGRLPFTGESAVDLVRQHCYEQPPSLNVVMPTLPITICGVIERALSKSVDARFPTVATFGDALRAAVRGELPEVTTPIPTSRATQHASRLRVAPLASWALGLGAVGLVAWIFLSERVRPGASANPARRPTVAALSVSPASHTMRINEPATLSITALDSAGQVIRDSQPVVWQSRDTNIAVINEHGVVIGRSAGSVSVGARLGSLSSYALLHIVAAAPTQPSQTRSGVRPAGVAFVSVGSAPLTGMSINGRQVTNPVVDHQVTAGSVRLHFDATDSTSAWDTTFNIAVGDHLNLRRLRLRKRM